MPVLAELNLYPVKSCGGISLREATVGAAGLASENIHDREWMVVDARGGFLTQRQYPRMALIKPRIKADTLELRAPGMLRLEIPLDLPDPQEAPTLNVKVWDDCVKAYDCDEVTAAWFSNALGVACRLARFHPDAARTVNPDRTGGIVASALFSDGYPMLVLSQASLEDLNARLMARGRQALPMNRFRPNIVIGDVGPFEEDYADTLTIGNAVLKPVKPCPRCPIPSIDQSSGLIGPDPLDILRAYRARDGGIMFGMNAVLQAGAGQVLKLGQEVEVSLAF